MQHIRKEVQEQQDDKPEDQYADRLSKRMCYLLRYGALREGLTVHDGGFVDVKELAKVNMMRHHTEEEILNEVETSLSHRNTKRFDRKDYNGTTYVRAMFCRNMEVSPHHEGTSVCTLLQTCIQHVVHNLQDYDLEDFPDEHIISMMINQLKRQKKLNSANLRQLLVPALERLDLNSVYVTQGILRTVYSNCPRLKVLSLNDCGYIVIDSIVETVLRKLPNLESLNIASCKHITDKSLNSMCKYGKNLRELNLCWIKSLSSAGLLNLVVNCEKLQHLDIYNHKILPETRDTLIEAARQREIKVVLKGLNDTDPDVTIENPSMMLPNFGKTW